MLQPAGAARSSPGRWEAARPMVPLRLDRDRPEVAVGDVFEGDRHHLARAVDRHMSEELQPEAGREIVALVRAAAFLEHRARPKRVVERPRMPGAGVERAGDEFPERLEIL